MAWMIGVKDHLFDSVCVAAKQDILKLIEDFQMSDVPSIAFVVVIVSLPFVNCRRLRDKLRATHTLHSSGLIELANYLVSDKTSTIRLLIRRMWPPSHKLRCCWTQPNCPIMLRVPSNNNNSAHCVTRRILSTGELASKQKFSFLKPSALRLGDNSPKLCPKQLHAHSILKTSICGRNISNLKATSINI